MPAISEQPDLLRALGRTLDAERAADIKITFLDGFVTVSWRRHGSVEQQRSLREMDLESLRAEAKALRHHIPQETYGGPLAETLRTLGQELSREHVDATNITEEEDGYRVSGFAKNHYFREIYPKGELGHLSTRKRLTRGGRGALTLSERLARSA